MAITQSGRRKQPLHVAAMAMALVLAAFTGGGLGLVWQSAGLGKEAPPPADVAATAAEDK